jgi:3-ketosteroid 9alpha-monooxygenase subunit B
MSVAVTAYDLRVLQVVPETADAHSVLFEVPEGAEHAFAYRPGQFLTLAVPSDLTGLVARSYSLSSSPHDGGPLTVTVKRTVAGYASNWICDHLREGSTVRVLPPSGSFTPTNLDDDLLLVAGGSGITPVMSIIRTALARGSGRIALFYANRDRESIILRSALDRLAVDHPHRLEVSHWLESEQGLPSEAGLRDFSRRHESYNAFVCGPAPFMELAMTVLRALGFPRGRRHQERFVSISGNPFVHETEVQTPSAGTGVRLVVELEGETYTFDDWSHSTRLLDYLESKGLEPPYSCREGECSTCEFQLLEGEVVMAANEVLDDDDIADGIRLACQSMPVGDVVRVKYGFG